MKTVGLITEYNPFHNGHAYHIQKALEVTGADAAVAVMSGNFVQRGTPAIMPKDLRAKCALLSGAAIVLELPVCFSTGSAEYFAQGAISLLDQLGCDSFCFGSECGDISKLDQVAELLTDEPEDYRNALKAALKEGYSFPAARQMALDAYADVLSTPNNILGIEYLKALKKRNSKIVPHTIARIGSGYHAPSISGTLSSATAIRADIQDLSSVKEQIPASCFSLMEETFGTRYPIVSNDFSLILKAKLLSETKESLCRYMDVTPDLANRILRQRNQFLNFEQFCDCLKTKELTRSRISRSLIHILLGITDAVIEDLHASVPYARILGFRSDASAVFSTLKQSASIPLISSPAQADLNAAGRVLLNLDLYASDLYESVITDKYSTPFRNELTRKLLKI